MRRTVLVTGAGGFVGKAVVPALDRAGWTVRQAARAHRAGAVEVGDIDGATNWDEALSGCDSVVHLAARVHIGGKKAGEDYTNFRATNRDGTLRLAREAARRGVKRLVFISTIKVNGEGTGVPFLETDTPGPRGAYAVSKHEAEIGLAEITRETGLETVVLRPPLVYGPGVGGNFRTLLSLVRRGLPLPLGSIRNSRSLVGVSNFASAIALALEHPAAVGRTYLVSDQHDLSTPDLIRAIADALGRPARLLPFPPLLLKLTAGMTGRAHMYEQVGGSLTVDSSAITRELGWRPVSSVTYELAVTASWFRSR